MISVPVFIQPDSEQDYLLGFNVLLALGISVVRANSVPLNASMKVLGEGGTANVNHVQVTTLPGLNGCFARAKVDVGLEGSCLLFEPDDQALAVFGVMAFESLVSVDQEGYTIIPLHNYHGSCVALNGEVPLGLVRNCETPPSGLPLTQIVQDIQETVAIVKL